MRFSPKFITRSSPTVTLVRNGPLNTACRTLIEESSGCEDDQAALQGAENRSCLAQVMRSGTVGLSGERGEDPRQSVELRVERTLPAVDLVERHAADLLSAEADHFPRIVVCQRIDCRSPKAGGEHAVERGRAPARLDVPEHGEVSLIGATGVVDEVVELA